MIKRFAAIKARLEQCQDCYNNGLLPEADDIMYELETGLKELHQEIWLQRYKETYDA